MARRKSKRGSLSSSSSSSSSGSTRKRGSKRQPSGGKVGSDPEAARRAGGQTDFGIPENRSLDEFTLRKSREAKFTPGGSHLSDPRQEIGATQQVRDSGVGKSDAGPGGASSGDLDPDFVGLDGSGLAQGGPDAEVTAAESTTGRSEEFASGPPARGEGNPKQARNSGPERQRRSRRAK